MQSAGSKKRSSPEDGGVDGEPSSLVPPVLGAEDGKDNNGGTVNIGDEAEVCLLSVVCCVFSVVSGV